MIALAFVAACGGTGGTATQTPGPVAPLTGAPTAAAASASINLPSAEELCALLTATDWGQFDYVTTPQPEVNTDGPGSAYCTYAGESGSADGLELDSFVGETVADAEETFDLITSGSDGDGKQITLPGADEAFVDASIDGEFGAIVVRTGRFTYTVSLPTSEQAEAQLLALAGIVLGRSTTLR
ncbi:MAG: hypothetical protein ABIP53_05140 [Candidatus Limnocylindrales bacterium]